MPIQETVSIGLDTVPIVRRAWRWLLERGLEVTFHTLEFDVAEGRPFLDEDKPIATIYVVKPNPTIFVGTMAEFVNNRSDRREVIRDATLCMKRRKLRFWRKTMFSIPVEQFDHHALAPTPLRAVEIPPMSKPVYVPLWANGLITVPLESLPRYLELVVEFRLVGPIRRMRRVVGIFKHDPGLVR